MQHAFFAHSSLKHKGYLRGMEAYIANVSRLIGIDPDEPIGIPSDKPSRWMMVGVAMAIQENGSDSLDYFAMLRGWELSRIDR